jgi:hypothetical protein
LGSTGDTAKTGKNKPAGRSNTSSSSGSKLGSRISTLPPWLSAFAAILGTILTAVGVFNLVDQPSRITTPTEPRVILENVLFAPDQVEGRGSFENVDPLVNEVLFIGRPLAETESWLAVEATMDPTVQRGPLQSGRWAAVRPSPVTVPYRWFAILWPASSGATGTEDLQTNGPESRFVVAKSAPMDTP